MHFKQKRLLIASQPYNPIPIKTKQKNSFIHNIIISFILCCMYKAYPRYARTGLACKPDTIQQ